jgi:hypothetical protein
MGEPIDQLRRDSNIDPVQSNQSDIEIKRALRCGIPTELGGELEENKWCPIESCSVQISGLSGLPRSCSSSFVSPSHLPPGAAAAVAAAAVAASCEDWPPLLHLLSGGNILCVLLASQVLPFLW